MPLGGYVVTAQTHQYTLLSVADFIGRLISDGRGGQRETRSVAAALVVGFPSHPMHPVDASMHIGTRWIPVPFGVYAVHTKTHQYTIISVADFIIGLRRPENL